MEKNYTLYNGNCLEVLKTLPDNSVDSIVTDPPYGLSFMGKKWDYDVPSQEIWEEALRVLKPGGYLLAFAGTRTQHRMAVRIEDAGFEIRDMIAWVYGSGFPKSLDISKAIDKYNEKPATNEKIIELKSQLIEMFDQCGLTRKKIDEKCGFRASNYLTLPSENKKYDPWVNILPPHDKWEIMKEVIGAKDNFDIDALYNVIEREVIGTQTKARSTSGKSALPTVGGDVIYETWEITAPATDEAKQWEGWGTALKPALEPITVARKPLIGTVAANVLKYGTGGINIDASRVGFSNNDDPRIGKGYTHHAKAGLEIGEHKDNSSGTQVSLHNTQGRFPANFIHDGSEEVVSLFPNTKAGGSVSGKEPSKTGDENTNCYGEYNRVSWDSYNDDGSAARFFYCAKTSKKDRNEGLEDFEAKSIGGKGNGIRRICSKCGASSLEAHTCLCEEKDWVNPPTKKNNHPTVKPTDLMRYLVRMVTPKGGTVLDPFMGSGSTGKGAMLEGFKFVGIELDPDYMEIAKARIEFANPEDEMFDEVVKTEVKEVDNLFEF